MNNIQIFQNEQFGKVRIAMNESNEPLFCLADVAKALGYSRPADAVNQHCKGVVILCLLHNLPQGRIFFRTVSIKLLKLSFVGYSDKKNLSEKFWSS